MKQVLQVSNKEPLIIFNNGQYRDLEVLIQKDAIFRYYDINLSHESSLTNIHIVFEGEGGEAELNGCIIADGNQRVENHILIDHKVGHCTSNVLYKYVLGDDAVGVFEGRVLVRENAQQTISQETNRNLCASENSRMHTKPEMEIYADDVKCSHGATVGQLNNAALFYMQQRGIPIQLAKQLLQQAFIKEVIEKITDESLREELSLSAEKRLTSKV